MRPPRGWDGMAEANEGLAATVATTRALLGVGSDGSALRSLTAEGRTMLDASTSARGCELMIILLSLFEHTPIQ